MNPIRLPFQLAFDFHPSKAEKNDPSEVPIDRSFPEDEANKLAALESYNKHLYRPNTYLHKWWARRSGTTFRYILKQLVDTPEKRDFYEGGGLEGKLIFDPMIGGGTILHEAIRMGANVMGVEGVALMLAASAGLPCDFFATVPSCVPTSGMETSGGEINAEQVSTLLAHPRVVGLGEMMNYPGVLNGNEEVLQKIFAARRAGKVVDGHAPALSGRALQAYTGSGISTDHESITAVEAREKLRNGMKIIIRHGSATSSLAELLPLVTPASSDMFMFGSDDREAGELLEKGHLDELLKTAVELGAEPLTVVKVASYNAARHFRLYDRGAVAVGYRADLVIFEDLNEFPVQMVFKDGRQVARAGHMLTDVAAYELPRSACCTVKLNRPLQEKDFTLSYPSEQVPVIGIIPGQLITEKLCAAP